MKRNRKIQNSETGNKKMSRRKNRKVKREMMAGFIRVILTFIHIRMRERYKERIMFEMVGDDVPRLFIRVELR